MESEHVKIRRTPLESGDLVGAVEASEILGVERTRVARYMKTGVMPDPVVTLRATRVWLRSDVEKLKAERDLKSAEKNSGVDAPSASAEEVPAEKNLPGSKEKYRGALLGLAACDALGTTVEFKPPGSFEPLTDMVGGGPFDLPIGAWTDDTSMALCLAESLIECQGFDPEDQMKRYVRWWRDGHLSSVGYCFDIGGATISSLSRFESTSDPYAGDEFPEAASNGALMRLAPVPLAFARHPVDVEILAVRSSRTTHGSVHSLDACRYYAGLIAGALRGATKDHLLGGEPFSYKGDSQYFESEKVRAVADGSFRERQPPDINGNGFVIDTLEAALWALWTTDNFESGALKVVNLGQDADTTGAVYGQLAGALYGVESIPEGWLEKLVMREEIERYADQLLDLSERLAR